MHLQAKLRLKKLIRELSNDERLELAAQCGTSINYIRKVLSSDAIDFGPELCEALEKNTGALVLREELRDDWRKQWPDLAARRDAQLILKPH